MNATRPASRTFPLQVSALNLRSDQGHVVESPHLPSCHPGLLVDGVFPENNDCAYVTLYIGEGSLYLACFFACGRLHYKEDMVTAKNGLLHVNVF